MVKNNYNVNSYELMVIKKIKRKLFRRTLAMLIIIFILLGYLYTNIDYLIFKHFISNHYIYTDTLDDIYGSELQTNVEGKYYRYFDNVAISIVTEKIRSINNDKYTYLYLPQEFTDMKVRTEAKAQKTEIKNIEDDIIYFHLTNFSKHSYKIVKENMAILKSSDKIIIDLTNNYGGDTFYMSLLIDLFLPRFTPMFTDHYRMLDVTYPTFRRQVLEYSQIIILHDKSSASASENFLGSLSNNLDNVVTMGSNSFGKGIGQYTMWLKRGYRIKATNMLWYPPDGKNIHGIGFTPDILCETDKLLDTAISYLK